VLATVVGARLDPLVVVVDGDREGLLRVLLADDVGVEELEDLAGLRELVEADLAALAQLLLDDLVSEVDALVADVDARSGDQLLDLLLALPAERALQEVASVTNACHARSSFASGRSGGSGVVVQLLDGTPCHPRMGGGHEDPSYVCSSSEHCPDHCPEHCP
jgi:hypothetical protein